PPCRPLFPYTTLFRSMYSPANPTDPDPPPPANKPSLQYPASSPTSVRICLAALIAFRRLGKGSKGSSFTRADCHIRIHPSGRRRDRKSTRLNSSHVKI